MAGETGLKRFCVPTSAPKRLAQSRRLVSCNDHPPPPMMTLSESIKEKGITRQLQPRLPLSEEQLKINKHLQEDELLAVEAIYGENLTIFQRGDGEQSFQMQIHVETSDEISILAKRHSFNKNVKSGETLTCTVDTDDHFNGFLYTFKVRHLPPITLTCLLPKSYPSHQPPQFNLSVQWLNSLRISNLCLMLNSLWTEQPGQEVIYLWAEWLRSSSLSYLGLVNEIVLDSYSMPGDEDSRAVPGSVLQDIDILSMVTYNDDKCNEVFRESWHECCICFSECAGTEFIRLPCKHYFCRKCMESYSSIHVKEGAVNKLLCPDVKCEEMIPPGLLKCLLGNEEFERWESLLLQKTLDTMSDLCYCPRCALAFLTEEDQEAVCPKCLFCFCRLCMEPRHSGSACTRPEEELEILKDRQGFLQLQESQRKKEKERMNEILSLRVIFRDSKQCPNCKIAIHRISGCKHMLCTNCRQRFNYA